MLMSFFILSGLFIVLVAVLVNCAKEVMQSREALAEQRELDQNPGTWRTVDRHAFSVVPKDIEGRP